MATIKIRNKRTGEVKEVDALQSADFGISPKTALEYVKAQQELQNFTEGKAPVEELDARGKSYRDAAQAALGALQTYQGGGVTTGPVDTRVQEAKQMLEGAEPTKGTTFRSQLAFSRTIIRNALLGGAISPQEAASLEAGLPTKTDQEKVVEQKLKDFITQFGGNYGVELPEEVAGKTTDPKTGRNLNAAPVLPNTPQMTSDGVPQPQRQIEQILFPGTNLPIMEKGGAVDRTLTGVANAAPGVGGTLGWLFGRVGGSPGAIAGATSGQVGGQAVQQSILNILGKANTPEEQLSNLESGARDTFVEATIAEGTGKVLSKVGKPFVDMFRRGAISKAREAAAATSGTQVNPSKILEAGEKYVAKNPEAAKLFGKFEDVIKTAKTPLELLDKMEVWKSAYTSAGKIGKSTRAGFFDTLYRAASKELKLAAPEVAKYTEALRKSYVYPKVIGKTVGAVGATAGAVGGGAYLFNLLRGNR